MAGGEPLMVLSSAPVRVLIADDHPVMRFGLRTMLEVAGCMVVAEATSGVEAVALALKLRPNVILMDVDMPQMNGLEATRRICAALPDVRVLMLTMFHNDTTLTEAVRAGAHGYVLKTAPQLEISRAVHAIANGEAVFGVGVAERILAAMRGSNIRPPSLPELTVREQEILALLAHRASNVEIAQRLGLSVKTVRNYLTVLLSKLQVMDRHEAGRLARDARSVPQEKVVLSLEHGPLVLDGSEHIN
jgi:DNA-binding NarL/FixJ family response regulator